MTESASTVRVMQRRLLRQGVPGRELMAHLAALSSQDGAQKGWSGWEEVRDRSELLLRLEVLARTTRLAPELADFILFFFRASDSALYQAAALALGRHRASHPVLDEEYVRYARLRNALGPGFLRPPGGRALRRILLVRCRTGAEDAEETPLPIAGELSPDLTWQDLAALLLGSDWWIRDRASEEIPSVVPELVERVMQVLPGPGDRALSGRLGDLLVTLGEHGNVEGEWIAETWRRSVVALAQSMDRGSAGQIANRLRCMDELARVHALLPAAVQNRTDPRGLELGWCGPEFLWTRLEMWERFLEGDGAFGLEPRRATRRGLTEGIRHLGDPATWLSFTAEDRAISLVRLLDPMVSLQLEEDETEELVRLVRGLPASGPAEGEVGAEAVPWSLVGSVLARFLSCEGQEAVRVLDPDLVHYLERETVPLVLRLDPGPELRLVLADALEHRFRLELALNRMFDPEAFLLQVVAARPSRYVFVALRELVGDRQYADHEGRVFPLADWLVRLEEELHAGAIAMDSLPPDWGLTGRLRRELLSQLVDLEADGDIRARLRRLATLLGGGHGATSTSGSGMADGVVPTFLRQINPTIELPFGVVALGLDDMVACMTPSRIDQVGRLRVLLSDVRQPLEKLVHALSAELPALEAEVLSRALRGAMEETEEVLHAFASLESGIVRAGAFDQDRMTGLVDDVLQVGDSAVRGACLDLLWRELSIDVGLIEDPGKSLTPTGSWRRAEALVVWAAHVGKRLGPEDRRRWDGAAAAGWRLLADDALGAGYAQRLSRILHAPSLEPLVAREDQLRILDEIRIWFLDVYRPLDAARALHLKQRAEDEGGTLARLRTIPRFLGHYGSVWLALLIGAILMLDFGDAWTAMAEVGDVRGIGITVGLGLVGAFAYIGFDLRRRIRPAPEDPDWSAPVGTFLRSSLFLLLCLVYTGLLTAGLWWLLSGTDEVVHGAGAVLHVAVWSGFALFVGVFFGLLAKGSG